MVTGIVETMVAAADCMASLPVFHCRTTVPSSVPIFLIMAKQTPRGVQNFEALCIRLENRLHVVGHNGTLASRKNQESQL